MNTAMSKARGLKVPGEPTNLREEKHGRMSEGVEKARRIYPLMDAKRKARKSKIADFVGAESREASGV